MQQRNLSFSHGQLQRCECVLDINHKYTTHKRCFDVLLSSAGFVLIPSVTHSCDACLCAAMAMVTAFLCLCYPFTVSRYVCHYDVGKRSRINKHHTALLKSKSTHRNDVKSYGYCKHYASGVTHEYLRLFRHFVDANKLFEKRYRCRYYNSKKRTHCSPIQSMRAICQHQKRDSQQMARLH